MANAAPDRTRALLRLLAEGASVERLLKDHPDLTPEDVRRAAAEALAALERQGGGSRAERIARMREKHPRAYEPWSEDEDAHLLRRWDEGTRVADLARETMRPPNAIRARLEKWLGPSWRARHAGPSVEDGEDA